MVRRDNVQSRRDNKRKPFIYKHTQARSEDFVQLVSFLLMMEVPALAGTAKIILYLDYWVLLR